MKEATYIRLALPLPEDHRELAVSVLSELGFTGFEEADEALFAFIPEEDYPAQATAETLSKLFPGLEPGALERIVDQDWNAQWEASFKAVRVGDLVEIHPPWQSPSGTCRYEVAIRPRMSFGTGHHHTTRLMAAYLEQAQPQGKQVLDMGTGTGVLGILASMMGAASVVGIDNDEWSLDNAPENLALNGIENMEIRGGEQDALRAGECYDIILANINRNVLLEHCAHYREHLLPAGQIILSGFFDFDADKIRQAYTAQGLEEVDAQCDDGWMRLAFRLNA